MKIGDLCPHCENGKLTLDSPYSNVLKCWKCGFRYYPNYVGNKPTKKGIPASRRKDNEL